MKEIYYTYNNEAIACCVLFEVLEKAITIDLARSCLILPFLLDDRTVKYFKQLSEENETLEFVIREQPKLFTSLNKRYLSLLPILVNSLVILNKNNQVIITTSEISIKQILSYDNMFMGDRFNSIKDVIPIFLRIIGKYSTIQLYRILKIQL